MSASPVLVLPKFNVTPKQGVQRRAGIRRPSDFSVEEDSKEFQASKRRTSTARGGLSSVSEFDDTEICKLVLEKTRSYSRGPGRVDAIKASNNLARYFDQISTDDILAESIKCIKNRIGSVGDQNFESKDLMRYLSDVFGKSEFEMDNISKRLEGAEHSVQVSLESTSLNKISKSVLCSVSLKEMNERFLFSTCNPDNTLLSTACSRNGKSNNIVWNSKLGNISLPHSRGMQLLVAVWELKKDHISHGTLERDAKCKGAVIVDLNDTQNTDGDYRRHTLTQCKALLKGKTGKTKGTVHIAATYNSVINQHNKAVMVRAGMLNRFLCHDIPTEGKLHPIAVFILQLHNTQQKLSNDELKFVDWLVQGERCLRTNSNYEKLSGTLVNLVNNLSHPREELNLAEEHVQTIWKSFRDFCSGYIDRMSTMNVLYPYTNETDLVELKYFSACYRTITSCTEWAKQQKHHVFFIQLKKSMEKNIQESLKNITSGFIVAPDEDILRHIDSAINFVTAIYVEVKQVDGKYIPHLLNTPFITTLLFEVNETIGHRVNDVLQRVITHVPELSEDATGKYIKILDSSLALYISVAQLKRKCEMIDAVEVTNLYLGKFHARFYNIICKWLDEKLIKNKDYINNNNSIKAAGKDVLEPVNNACQWSWMVFDVECMNLDIVGMLDNFDFPDTNARFTVTLKMNNVITESYLTMCNQLLERGKPLLAKGEERLIRPISILVKGKLPLEEKDEDISPHLVLSSSLHRIVTMLEDLPSVLAFHHFSGNTEQEKQLMDKVHGVKRRIREEKNKWIVTVCEKVLQSPIKRAFRHFMTYSYELDEYVAAEELYHVIENLIITIDLGVPKCLVPDFIRSLWDRIILPLFVFHLNLKSKSIVKIPKYYHCVNVALKRVIGLLVDHSQNLQTDIDENSDLIQMNLYLECLSESSDELLYRYFDREIAAQERKIEEGWVNRGTISFTARLVPQGASMILNVRVLRCESLPKMDTIGSCDAIVKLAIHPKYTKELEKLKSYKTKTVKSLNPEFPEHNYTQTISLDFSSLTRPKAVCLSLAVWDEDFYGPDDFVGESLMPLEEFLHATPTKVFTRPLFVPDLDDSLYSVLKQRAVYNGPIKKFVELRNKMTSSDAPKSPRKSFLNIL